VDLEGGQYCFYEGEVVPVDLPDPDEEAKPKSKRRKKAESEAPQPTVQVELNTPFTIPPPEMKGSGTMGEHTVMLMLGENAYGKVVVQDAVDPASDSLIVYHGGVRLYGLEVTINKVLKAEPPLVVVSVDGKNYVGYPKCGRVTKGHARMEIEYWRDLDNDEKIDIILSDAELARAIFTIRTIVSPEPPQPEQKS
jgi:hypothetical protein